MSVPRQRPAPRRRPQATIRRLPHLRILQRYLAASLVKTAALALLILVAVTFFLSLADQLEEAQAENYGVALALLYALLTVPRLIYELLPIAAMIAGMVTLGLLARNNELDVIRTSGVSKLALASLLGKSALIIALFSIFISEFVAPASEREAQRRQGEGLARQVSTQTKQGFWARDGNSFINIQRVLPGNRVENIYIYEFDNAARLRNSIFAARAEYVDSQWLLEGIVKTAIHETGVERQEYEKASWPSLLDPRKINLAAIDPQRLSAWGLYHYLRFLRLNAQSAVRYQQTFYEKLIRPVTIVAMILLAIPLVGARAQPVAVGYHVFTGALLGALFYLCNTAAHHVGVVYGLPPLLSATAPTLALILILCHSLGAWGPALKEKAKGKPPQRAKAPSGTQGQHRV